jgi:hypothetical protein
MLWQDRGTHRSASLNHSPRQAFGGISCRHGATTDGSDSVRGGLQRYDRAMAILRDGHRRGLR